MRVRLSPADTQPLSSLLRILTVGEGAAKQVEACSTVPRQLGRDLLIVTSGNDRRFNLRHPFIGSTVWSWIDGKS